MLAAIKPRIWPLGVLITTLWFPCFLKAATLRLNVLNAATAEPIPGAEVHFKTDGIQKDFLTDATGAIELPLAAQGAVEVVAYKRGFAPMRMPWNSPPPQFDLLLPEAQAVGGRVLDNPRQPISNVRVSLSVPQRLKGPYVAMELFPLKSDAEGRWSCDWVPKDADYITVELNHPDYEASGDPPAFEAIQSRSAEQIMNSVQTVRGTILAPDGRPVSEAFVTLGVRDQIFPSRETPETRSDSEGRFSFARVQGNMRTLGVKADGFAPLVKSVTVRRDMPELEVRLDRGSPLKIRVVDEQRNPIPNATFRVSAFPADGGDKGSWNYPSWEWRADQEGRFVWSNAPTQAVAWSISKAGYMGVDGFAIKPSEQEQAVTLLSPFRIGGKVIDAQTKNPVPEFVINSRFVQNYDGRQDFSEWTEYNRQNFSGGQYSLNFERALLMGSAKMHDWQFRVEADGYNPALSPVFPQKATGTNFNFTLQPAAIPEVQIEPLTEGKRVAVGAAFQHSKASSGQAVPLFVRIRIAPGHHIYALDEKGSNNEPSAIKVNFPPTYSFSLAGPWHGPEPKVVKGQRIYEGEVLFRNQVLIGSYMAQKAHKFSIETTFQVCNEALCWPPEKVTREVTLEIVSGKNE